MKNFSSFLFLLLLLFLSASVTLAVPHEIHYQGVLRDNYGKVMYGAVNMTFSIYDGDGPSAQSLWNEKQNGITLEAGLYNVQLGAVNAIPPEVFNGSTRYLEITVNGQTFSPRIPLISVPYAFHAEELGGLSAEAFVKLGPSATQETSAERALSIKSNNPSGHGGYFKVMGSGKGVYGFSFSGKGVHGESLDDAGVYGTCSAGKGVYGLSYAPDGKNYGVYGECRSSDGYGIYGVITEIGDSGAGAGVKGVGWVGVSGEGQSVGVYGISSDGYGVYGKSSKENYAGVYGENDSVPPSVGGPGVAGFSLYNMGVRGYGKYGVGGVGSDTGIYGNGGGVGVYGESENGPGIEGHSSSESGVEGYGALFGVAGFSSGGTKDSAGVFGTGPNDTNVMGGYFKNFATDDKTPTLRAEYSGSQPGPLFELLNSASKVPLFVVMRNGDVYVNGKHTHDIAETLKIAELDIAAGDVVVADSDMRVKKCYKAYDTALVGVISTKPTITMGDSETDNGEIKKPVALTGIVPTKVDASFGAVKVGDLLTTSNIPGYAMKATDPKVGTVLGKAMEPLASGKGKIMVLVTLQ